MNFQTLPAEIRFQIFSYFTPPQLQSIVAPVCKDWLQISKQSILWQNLEFGFNIRNIPTNEQILRVLRQSPLVRKLTFRAHSNFGWLSVSPQLKFVQNITLDNFCELTTVDAQNIFKVLPNVLKIKIEACCVPRGDYYHLQWLANWKYLKSISIDFAFTGVDLKNCLQFIAQNFEFLEELFVSNYRYLCDNSLIEFLKTRGGKLKALGLGNLHHITRKGYEALTRYCPNLTSIHLLDTANMSDEDLSILQEVKSLTMLKFRQCFTHLNTGINLFSNVNSTIFQRMIFPQVTEISFAYFCNDINDTNLPVIMKCFPAVQKLSFVLSTKSGISDLGLAAVLPKYCRKLRFLFLRAVVNMNDTGVATLKRSMPYLESFKTEACYKLNWNGEHMCN